MILPEAVAAGQVCRSARFGVARQAHCLGMEPPQFGQHMSEALHLVADVADRLGERHDPYAPPPRRRRQRLLDRKLPHRPDEARPPARALAMALHESTYGKGRPVSMGW